MLQAKSMRLSFFALVLFACAAASIAQQTTVAQQTAPNSGGATLAAQDTARQDQSSGDSSTLTLHVATNLVRIPVLVLSPQHEMLPSPIAPDRFTIQFGSGPSIRPKYVRREGDDPINLAFVVDIRRPQEPVLPKIDEAIASLAPSYLRAGDGISIYTLDCSRIGAVENVPADRAQLKTSVDLALSNWTERQRLKKKPPCSAKTHLWDDLEYVTGKLAKQSGWRVIIAVTNGDDRSTTQSSDGLIFAAQNEQVTILGLDPFQDFRGPLLIDPAARQLAFLCESTGGLRLDLYQSSVAKRMQLFMQMLRERYILEFPRPPIHKAGPVQMNVRIGGINAFIRPAGDGVPVTDEVLASESAPIPGPPPPTSPHGDNSTGATPAAVGPSTARSPTQPPAAEPSPTGPSPARTSATDQAVVQQPAPVAPAATPSVPAQKAAIPQEVAPESGAATIKSTSRLTLVDVTATDSKDKPLHGLRSPNLPSRKTASRSRSEILRNSAQRGRRRRLRRSCRRTSIPTFSRQRLPPARPRSSCSTMWRRGWLTVLKRIRNIWRMRDSRRSNI
jgi:hypothetical protein